MSNQGQQQPSIFNFGGGLSTLTAAVQQIVLAINNLANYVKNIFPLQTYQGSTTYAPPSLANGAYTSENVTVTGAAIGNYAVAAFGASLMGVTMTASVSAANTVTVTFTNSTGATVTLPSSTLSARTFS